MNPTGVLFLGLLLMYLVVTGKAEQMFRAVSGLGSGAQGNTSGTRSGEPGPPSTGEPGTNTPGGRSRYEVQ